MAAAPFSSSGAALAEERGQAVAAAQAMLAKAQAVCFDVDSTVITEVRGEKAKETPLVAGLKYVAVKHTWSCVALSKAGFDI